MRVFKKAFWVVGNCIACSVGGWFGTVHTRQTHFWWWVNQRSIGANRSRSIGYTISLQHCYNIATRSLQYPQDAAHYIISIVEETLLN